MNPLPEGFVEYISRYTELSPLALALETGPEVAVRINPRKYTSQATSAVLGEALSGENVPWCTNGFYLDRRPQFTFDPAIHQGLYYVQDASSMAIDAVIRRISGSAPLRYLDACAAPGGKTTAAISALPAGSLVVANEYDFKRAEILAENLAKWGSPCTVASRGATSRIARLEGFFDIVAVDAPCSGEGMMRKEDVARTQWSEHLVEECAATQRSILQNVWRALRPGGYLIYSTCTFNRTENEENVAWLINSFDAAVVNIPELDSAPGVIPGILCDFPCYRFLPGNVRGEGLFIAVLRKPGAGVHASVKSSKEKPSGADRQAEWLKEPVAMCAVGDEVYALPKPLASEMQFLHSKLDVISMGVHVASIKGKDVVPHHALALSEALNTEKFPIVAVDEADAIRYLQRESFPLPPDTPKGYVLLTFCSTPLGFMKNLGSRANNLLPKNWRILSRR